VGKIALKVLELVKSLPLEEQRLICQELAKGEADSVLPISERDGDELPFTAEDYKGIENNDPFFKVMEEIEADRHRTPAM
jgi:hypothetical protein